MEISPSQIMSRAAFVSLTKELLRTLSPSADSLPAPEATPEPDTAADEDDSLSYWSKRKERALAEKHELELAIKRGQFCAVEETCRQLEHEFSTIRERLLCIAGKLADVLAHRNRDEVFATLSEEVHATLSELSEPAAIAARVVEQY
jgi:hypothetical protein